MQDPFFWGIAVVLYVSNKLSELKRQVQHVKGRGLSVLFFCFFHLRPPLPHQILRFDVILTASVGIQLSAFAMSTPYNTAVALGKIELESLKKLASWAFPILRQIMFFCPIRHSISILPLHYAAFWFLKFLCSFTKRF